MRIGILTGGGDAAGLNAAIRAVCRRASAASDTVMAIKNGWAGLMGAGNWAELYPQDVSGILPLGGTILGTSRTNPLRSPDALMEVGENLGRAGLDALIAIGGNDTLSVALALSRAGHPVVGVPKTIDNDLMVTEYCIGFDSAVGIVAEALDRLHTTAASHHRAMVVEVMGRDTGWLALMGGLAGGADIIVIPEFAISLGEIAEHVVGRHRGGKDFSIVVVAEGATVGGLTVPSDSSGEADQFGHQQLAKRAVGEAVAAALERQTGFETRVTVLGHTQRGGAPSAYDRIWATRVGIGAYDLVRQGRFGRMAAKLGDEVVDADLSEVVAGVRAVPSTIYDLARIFY